jgi:hypothetical protein
MSDISYRMHQNEHSFETVEDTIESLPLVLEVETPQVWNESVTSDIESILADVSFDTLERTGLQTMLETTYVSYEFERPNVTVRVSGKYETQTEELQETSIKVNLGEHPEHAVVDFIVRPDGYVEIDNVVHESD